MYKSAVNLGAGGHVRYMQDGGATVELMQEYLGNTAMGSPNYGVMPEEEVIPPQNNDYSQQFIEEEDVPSKAESSKFIERVSAQETADREPQYPEKGLMRVFSDSLFTSPSSGVPLPLNSAQSNQISSSGQSNAEMRDVFYPEGPTFYETLATDYGYPDPNVDPLSGPTRMDRPPGREDMPTPQELRDVRSHMLGSALMAREYGPETALAAGDFRETYHFGNRLHNAMDRRNNAVGVDIFRKAGMNATPAQLAQMVDSTIYAQLSVILGRKRGERGFSSPEGGPDVYFPRDSYGYFLPDH